MSFQASPGSMRSRWLLLAAVALVGTLLSAAGYWALLARENREIEDKFRRDADIRSGEISRSLRRVSSVLYRASYTVGRGATREEYGEAVNAYIVENPDLLALYWAPRVPPGELEEHETRARKEGLAEYRVTQLGKDGKLVAAQAQEGNDLFPIYYLEPTTGNRRTLGFNLASDPEYWEAMLRARDSDGMAAARGRLWLQGDGTAHGMVIFRAVYPEGLNRESPERQEKLLGFVACAVRLDSLIENALAQFPVGINTQLFSEAPDGTREFMAAYDSRRREVQFTPLVTPPVPGLSGQPAISPPARPATTSPQENRGRRTIYESMPTPEYVAERRTPTPLVTLFVGLLITATVTTYVSMLIGRAAKVEELVVRRTAELQQATASLEIGEAEKRKAEENLALERFLLSTLMNTSPDYIYFKDADSRFLRISRALSVRFGLADPSEAIGKSDFEYFEQDRAKEAFSDEREVMQTGKPIVDKEERQRWPDGLVTWVTTTKVRLVNEKGEAVGTFGISRDITDRRQSAAQLHAAKEAAEAASRAKSTFLANMSHEIRTPLNAVIGMTDLVLGSPLSQEQRERLAVVQESGELLLSVINDILDFSKIEAGRLELDAVEFDLRESLGDTLKWLAMRADSKGLEMGCRIAQDVPKLVCGDNTRLRQIIVNLVGNAIKFTERGEVIIEVRRQSQTDKELILHFCVTDTGIGIAKQKLKRVFEAFEQADNTMTRRFGGTGLGLPISSRLVDLMGGRIWVESEVGRGSRFHFTARFGLVEHEAGQSPEAAGGAVGRLNGVRALVVDDSGTNRCIVEEMILSCGMDAAVASNASEALAVLSDARQEGNPFQLVISDARMPEMDGFHLAEAIRQQQDSARLIMMLTGADRAEDIARCERVGVAACLTKPIKQSELFDAVLLALGVETARDAESEKVTAQISRLRPLRILLAEDSLVNQKLAVGLLENYGHSVAVAGHGGEAVAKAAEERFDLVLMDVQMPEVDGLEAASLIRAAEKQSGAHVPIVAMTAHAMKGDRERCLEAGMDDYIAKPIRAQRLFQTIEAVLERQQPAAASPAPQAAVAATPPSSEAVGGEPLAPPNGRRAARVVDWTAAREAVDGDQELLRSLAAAFLAEFPGLLASIRSAVMSGAADSLARNAHKLKGTLQYFGATRAFEAAAALEALGKAGRASEGAEGVAVLETELASIGPDLTEFLEYNTAANPS